MSPLEEVELPSIFQRHPHCGSTFTAAFCALLTVAGVAYITSSQHSVEKEWLKCQCFIACGENLILCGCFDTSCVIPEMVWTRP